MANTEIYYQVTVGLRFRKADVPVLRELARRDWTHDEDDRSVFAKAADAAEADEVLVVQCMTRAELQSIVASFPQAGVSEPSVEDLATYIPPNAPFRSRV